MDQRVMCLISTPVISTMKKKPLTWTFSSREAYAAAIDAERSSWARVYNSPPGFVAPAVIRTNEFRPNDQRALRNSFIGRFAGFADKVSQKSNLQTVSTSLIIFVTA